ncbi:predicted protein [Chaetomium globosum CBS 148.51]|uniref:Uncharacterized protein n=1 Tax=Chaetomium globosum (strain ATCC 6205 / CBS 148.51 / DSM 1962 / NBRC 6347 / NRRL 1970) TaxID=306901 RepID=Q2GSE1_CHAGB|nr:uncharacterized protein CHGG_09113 [Chaetomium globosum CBS 148.51]EAQ85099.1 predicted protein [Chaetomium globosum CBS 148.51]
MNNRKASPEMKIMARIVVSSFVIRKTLPSLLGMDNETKVRLPALFLRSLRER